MPQSRCYSLRTTYKAPPLSAINHESHPTSFEEVFILPSSYHGRTWLLDNFQETCGEPASCKEPSHEQELHRVEKGGQVPCLPRGVQTTCFNSRCWEMKTCQSESSEAMSGCVSQYCQPGSIHCMGFVARRGQPGGWTAKCCPHNTCTVKSHQSLQCESSQCQCQSSEHSSCSCVSSGKPILKSSSSYEPTCCITGGLELPTK